ncbi:ornithine transporter 2 [Teratosphaeria destructans]|uniref:Ornithine transporter 2 n=1 Tax=Teratosphaeria destructans TaxID=418781 RepID=A0A9W7SQH5_9PEZI|nr:ornithine transporter 2 [Teratosphaeria destructans]
MAADFWAGYSSGAIGILVGNPLDIIKTRLQAGSAHTPAPSSTSPTNSSPPKKWSSFARGAAAPILGYGALNALLFMTYNRSLGLLTTGDPSTWPEKPPYWSIWAAGALGGFATFVVSAPTELVKCRAQVSNPSRSSWDVTKVIWQRGGLRGLYLGGGVTSLRDAVGYGFYFWSYELSKNALTFENESQNQQGLKVLFCGGLAGVVTWASVFPLAQDVIKTRYQTWDLASTSTAAASNEAQPLISSSPRLSPRPSTMQIARQAYASEGLSVFFRGLGVCSARAFIVNAVQWAIYEYTMHILTTPKQQDQGMPDQPVADTTSS